MLINSITSKKWANSLKNTNWQDSTKIKYVPKQRQLKKNKTADKKLS